jgi:hypothetical protein
MTAWEAIAYAHDPGWPVFPSKLVRRANGKLDKVPLIKDWANAASCDPTQIYAWWRKWPDAVISIPTGARTGVIVLDIDIRDDRNGFDTLHALGKDSLPETPISHTRSGGVHLWFARTDLAIRNSAGTKGLGPGLDIRGDGGQVVLPSVNSLYWWDPEASIDNTPLTPAPAWLGHRERPERPSWTLGRGFDPQATLEEACQRIRTAADGEKHHTLNREVFSISTLVAAGLLAEADTLRALQTATSILIRHSDADRKRTWHTFGRAFADGLAAPRRAQR